MGTKMLLERVDYIVGKKPENRSDELLKKDPTLLRDLVDATYEFGIKIEGYKIIRQPSTDYFLALIRRLMNSLGENERLQACLLGEMEENDYEQHKGSNVFCKIAAPLFGGFHVIDKKFQEVSLELLHSFLNAIPEEKKQEGKHLTDKTLMFLLDDGGIGSSSVIVAELLKPVSKDALHRILIDEDWLDKMGYNPGISNDGLKKVNAFYSQLLDKLVDGNELNKKQEVHKSISLLLTSSAVHDSMLEMFFEKIKSLCNGDEQQAKQDWYNLLISGSDKPIYYVLNQILSDECIQQDSPEEWPSRELLISQLPEEKLDFIKSVIAYAKKNNCEESDDVRQATEHLFEESSKLSAQSSIASDKINSSSSSPAVTISASRVTMFSCTASGKLSGDSTANENNSNTSNTVATVNDCATLPNTNTPPVSPQAPQEQKSRKRKYGDDGDDSPCASRRRARASQ